MSGFSAGEVPGGQTGICLFGIGIGHADDEFIEPSCSEFVGVASDDSGLCGGIGRGKAIVVMATGVGGGRLTRLDRSTR